MINDCWRLKNKISSHCYHFYFRGSQRDFNWCNFRYWHEVATRFVFSFSFFLLLRMMICSSFPTVFGCCQSATWPISFSVWIQLFLFGSYCTPYQFWQVCIWFSILFIGEGCLFFKWRPGIQRVLSFRSSNTISACKIPSWSNFETVVGFYFFLFLSVSPMFSGSEHFFLIVNKSVQRHQWLYLAFGISCSEFIVDLLSGLIACYYFIIFFLFFLFQINDQLLLFIGVCLNLKLSAFDVIL